MKEEDILLKKLGKEEFSFKVPDGYFENRLRGNE